MDNRPIVKLTIMLLLCASPLARSIEFSEIDVWVQGKHYQRGDVVAVGFDMYINVIPRVDIDPSESHIAWRKVNYRKRYELGEKFLFLPGQVVTYNGKFYIARKVNVLRRATALSNGRRWLEFNHPGILYDLPDTDHGEGPETLLGKDSNGNGVRDDYEISVVFSDLPPDVVSVALDAGKAYGALMQLSTVHFPSDQQTIREILVDLYLAEQCKRKVMRENDGKVWTEAAYFNTIDRIEAKYKLQNLLVDSLSSEPLSFPDGDSCATLNSRI